MENEASGIKAIIFDNKSVALQTIEDIRLIRIKDKNFNLMIMKDYWPVLGEINGSIYIEKEETLTFDDIRGFFLISHNVFYLVLKDEEDQKNE